VAEAFIVFHATTKTMMVGHLLDRFEPPATNHPKQLPVPEDQPQPHNPEFKK
jgi:hypothetical protein